MIKNNDRTSPPQPEPPDFTPDNADWYTSPDVILQKLSSFANAGGAASGTGITLAVPGGLLSGYVESQQDYLRSTAEVFREAAINGGSDGRLPENADLLAASLFEEPAQQIDDLLEAEKRASPEAGAKTARWMSARHIHLWDAYYTVPGAKSAPLGHTRVLLSQVSAWTLGVAQSS